MSKTKNSASLIYIEGEQLRAALKAVGTATSNADPGGAVVRITGKKNDEHLWLTAANPTLSVEYKMPTESVIQADITLTTAYPLLNSVARHVKGLVHFELQGGTLLAKGDALRVVLPLFTVPVVAMRDAEEPLEPLFSASYPDTDSWFKRASWAADARAEKVTFLGPHLIRDGDKTAVVASDTRVMVVYFVEGATMHSDDIQIPTHFLSALSRMGVEPRETVTFNTNTNSTKVIVQVGDRVVMASPLMYGFFPGLWKTYAYHSDPAIYTSYTVSTEEVTEALQRTVDIAAAQQHAKNLYVRFKFENGVCDLTVFGAANEIDTQFLCSADDSASSSLTINVDPALLLPFLKRCDSEAVVMNIPNVTSAHKPVVVTDGVYDTAQYRCIIAPVRG